MYVHGLASMSRCHATREAVGTNLPLQLGFSTGVNLVAVPTGYVDTPNNTDFSRVSAKPPPGDQFKHLIPLMYKGLPWNVVRIKIVQMLSDTPKISLTESYLSYGHMALS